MLEAIIYIFPDFSSNLEPWIALIMVLLYVTGCMSQRQVIKALASYEPIDNEPKLRCWKEAFVDALPGVFVLFGLLVTFVGLGLAIHHAAEGAANSSSAQIASEKLNSALLLVGVKFKTSVWGIIGNLAFRAFVSEKVVQARLSADRKIRLLHNNMVVERHSDLVILLKELVQINKSVSNDVNNIVTAANDIKRGFNTVQTSMTRAAENLNTTSENMGKSLESTIQKLKNNMDSTISSLNSATSSLVEAVGGMKEAIRDGLDTAGKTIASSASDLSQTTKNLETSVVKSLNNMAHTIGASLEDAGKKIAAATNNIEKASKSSSQTLHDATKDLNKNLKSGLNDLKEEVKSIKDFSGNIKSLQIDLNLTIKGVKEALERTNEWAEKLASYVAKERVYEKARKSSDASNSQRE